jgi:hypothetical protein
MAPIPKEMRQVSRASLLYMLGECLWDARQEMLASVLDAGRRDTFYHLLRLAASLQLGL